MNRKTRMEWIAIAAAVTAVAAFMAFRQADSVSDEAAREHLKQGAKVIDVRSAEEYRERHLPHTINIPLDYLEQQIGRVAPDKSAVLLLHCLSGSRSGAGARLLKGMGYARAFNLGSFANAERILGNGGK
jgi:rhodanese-related sulfurtransferase